MPTIKPFDAGAVLKYANDVRAVVSVEEHIITGGLGSAVAEVLAEADFGGRPKRFRRIGIPDKFPDEYGTQASQMETLGITQANIVNTITSLMK
jgi:transketolase